MKTILIVDDERGTRESVRVILEDSYNVRLAASGQEAIKAIGEDEIDLVFLDILMPGLDGLTVIKEIRKKSGAEVVILTAVKDIRMAVKAMKLGAADYLVKPFDADELRRLVERIVRPRKKGDEPDPSLPAPVRVHSLEAAEHDLKRRLILDALEKCHWNQTRAAQRLKISRRKLKYRMDILGILPEKGKGRPRKSS
ncbi:MAG: response regulator [Candidatus Aureabacteria bacterium]|nr:response regulator [Candidatus Auribacterota bacterium]